MNLDKKQKMIAGGVLLIVVVLVGSWLLFGRKAGNINKAPTPASSDTVIPTIDSSVQVDLTSTSGAVGGGAATPELALYALITACVMSMVGVHQRIGLGEFCELSGVTSMVKPLSLQYFTAALPNFCWRSPKAFWRSVL